MSKAPNPINGVIEFKARTRPEDAPPMLEKVQPSVSSCQHRRLLVDEAKSDVTCKDCGERINPIWILNEMSKKESWHRTQVMDMRRRIEKLSSKLRCKCEHCGKMTRIER